MNLTSQQLRTVFPLCRDPSLWASILPKVADEFEINTKDRFAAWLAQCGHESTQFNVLRENLSYSKLALMKTWPKRFPTEESALPYERQPERLANFVYAGRLGNGDTASNDGWTYRGGGIIQATGRGNYHVLGVHVGEPLEQQPAKIMIPVVAARVAGAFWQASGCNELADNCDHDSITEAMCTRKETQVVNGGQNGVQERLLNLAKWLAVLQ